MSIEKADSSYLKIQKAPFTILLNEVLQKLTNGEALAIWAHLQSLPENWIVNKKYLMNHFGWGRDKISEALRYLEDHKLLIREQEKNSNGTFGKSYIEVRCGHEFIPDKINHRFEINHQPPLTENQRTVDGFTVDGFTVDGKSAPIKEIYNTNKNKKQRGTERKKRAPLSQDFKPDQERINLAKETSQRSGISIEDLLRKFKAISNRKEKMSCDWQSDFEIFLINERSKESFSGIVKSTYRSDEPARPTMRDFTAERLQREDEERILKQIAKQGCINNEQQRFTGSERNYVR